MPDFFRARWGAAIALLGVCALAVAWFPLLSITALPSVNYNEGWNAYRQWMTLKHQPLYGSLPGLWTTNYPFLSFHIIGLLGGAKAHMVPAGRMVCFASFVLVSVLAGAIVRGATGSRAGAVYAGLCVFAGIGAFNGTGRAADDPEMLSAAFAMFGLFAFMRGPRRMIWLALAAVAFSLSLFTKHDLIGFPLSAGMFLLVTRNGRGLAVFAACGLAACGLLLGLSYHLDGPYFFAAFLQPRAYGWANLGSESFHYLLHFAAPLLIGLVFLCRERAIPLRCFLCILLLVTNVMAIGFAGGDGVASNIFYPALIADLLACSIAMSWQDHTGRPFRTALIIATLSIALMVPTQLGIDIAAQRHLPAATNAAQQATVLLASTNGPAICEDLLLCYEAGKPMDFDPYYVKDQIRIGRVQEQNIDALLMAHHYAAIQVNTKSMTGRGRFTNAFLRVFLAQYRPALVYPHFAVFVPRR